MLVTDAAGAAIAAALSIDESIELTVGASVDTVTSAPVTLRATVVAKPGSSITIQGDSHNGFVIELVAVAVAVVESGNITVVVSEYPIYNIDPSLLRQLGIEPASYQLINTKSPCGFRTAYRDVSEDVILMQSPSTTSSDFASLPWRNIDRPLFPLDRVEDLSWTTR